MNSKLSVLAAALLALALISGCTSQSQNSGEQVTAVFAVDDGTTVQDFSTEAANGSNAFEAMKKAVEVDYQDSAMGVFVKGINGVSAESGEYWALYVEGDYADKGISLYEVTAEQNSFEWKLEKIDYSKFS